VAHFAFDESKDFQSNLEEFLVHVSDSDPQMGHILGKHLEKLKGGSDDNLRRTIRTSVNMQISDDLDIFATTLGGPES